LIKDSTKQDGDLTIYLTILNNTYPPVSSNMAMENTLFIGDLPIETTISSGFLIATFDDTGG